jgi:hypothetical protein
MTLASSLDALFAGPSTGLVAAILLLAVCATAAVFWTLIRLIVDPRARIADDSHHRPRLEWDEVVDPAYDDGYTRTTGDGTR